MLFAAGYGTRMGSLTANIPKPLLRAGNRTLIDHALSVVIEARSAPCVVNTHYKADMLSAHLRGMEDVIESLETPELLDTGGGLLAARHHLGSEPVYTLNSDTVWLGSNPLLALDAHWPSFRAGALLLLSSPSRAGAHHGLGDFVIEASGRIRRCRAGEPGLVYTGAQIIDTGGLQEHGQSVFSLNLEWDRLVSIDALYGIPYEGNWIDVGTPEGLKLADQALTAATHTRTNDIV